MEKRRVPGSSLGACQHQKSRKSRGDNRQARKKQPGRKEEKQNSVMWWERRKRWRRVVNVVECGCQAGLRSLWGVCYVPGSELSRTRPCLPQGA